jgi:DNA ligase (NAD+)
MTDQFLLQKTNTLLGKIRHVADIPHTDVKKLIVDLRDVLLFHNRKYYIEDAPVISDTDYDALFTALKKLEQKFPQYITPDSPTQKIVVTVQSELKEVEHLSPMLSLENTYNMQDLRDFEIRIRHILKRDDPIEYMVELKYDGMGIALVYDHDLLVRGATRGDGSKGEDVTANIKTIKNIPLKAFFTQHQISKVEIRGEIVMPKKSFAAVNESREKEGLPPFANPRNAAAGSVRQLDTAETKKRDLVCYLYHISYLEGLSLEAIGTHEQAMELLRSLGLPVSQDYQKCTSIEEVMDYIAAIEKKRDEFPFEIDGMVIKVNRFDLQDEVGYTMHHPRWAVAYKFSARQAETILKDISFQVGRTGVVTPVAELEPVALGGVVIKRATLHNKDFVETIGVKIGDTVVIERAGDVIPQVVKPVIEKRTGKEKDFKMISSCPECGSPLVQLSDEVAFRCPNLSCPAQIKEGIIHFVSKDCMDINGLGEKVVELLLEHKKIHHFADLYSLQYRDFIGLPNFGDKSIQNLLESIAASKQNELWRVIHALGIRHVGKKTAKTLAEHIDSLFDLTDEDISFFTSLPDIGPIVAESIVKFMQEKRNQQLLQQLKDAGVRLEHRRPQRDANLPLVGKIFVFTGELEKYSREEAQEMVEKLGAKTSSSVSSKTSYVVVGKDPGSKAEKAKKLHVSLLDEQAFLDLLQRHR